jgi:hypothetical protein
MRTCEEIISDYFSVIRIVAEKSAWLAVSGGDDELLESDTIDKIVNATQDAYKSLLGGKLSSAQALLKTSFGTFNQYSSKVREKSKELERQENISDSHILQFDDASKSILDNPELYLEVIEMLGREKLQEGFDVTRLSDEDLIIAGNAFDVAYNNGDSPDFVLWRKVREYLIEVEKRHIENEYGITSSETPGYDVAKNFLISCVKDKRELSIERLKQGRTQCRDMTEKHLADGTHRPQTGNNEQIRKAVGAYREEINLFEEQFPKSEFPDLYEDGCMRDYHQFLDALLPENFKPGHPLFVSPSSQ